MSASLVDTYMISQLAFVVKNFFKVFATFFRLFLGLVFGGFVFPFTLMIIAAISQNARVNIAQNARAGFVQFAGGWVIGPQ